MRNFFEDVNLGKQHKDVANNGNFFSCFFLSCFLTKREKKGEKEIKRRRKEGGKKRREGNGKKKCRFGSFLVDYVAATYTVQVFPQIRGILPS